MKIGYELHRERISFNSRMADLEYSKYGSCCLGSQIKTLKMKQLMLVNMFLKGTHKQNPLMCILF